MKRIFIFSLIVLLASCSTSNSDTSLEVSEKTEAAKQKETIDRLMPIMFNSEGNSDSLRLLLSSISEYATQADSTDTAAANYLIKAAGFYQARGNKKYQINLYERLISKFYNTPKTSETLYVCGHLHWEEGNNDRAKTLMIQLVDDFPESPYAKEAETLIPQMDKTHEEWMNSIILGS